MGSIRRPTNPGSRSTEDTAFIQCVDGRDTQIQEWWCLGLDNITQEFHPTAQVEVVSGTVGEYTINYLAENGLIIPFMGKIPINDSVQFLGIPDFVGVSGLSFLPNLKYTSEPTGWGNGGTPNQIWGGSRFGTYSTTSVDWGASVDPFMHDVKIGRASCIKAPLCTT